MIETRIGFDQQAFYALFPTEVSLVLACFAVVCLFTGKNREVRKIWSSQKLTVNRLIRLRYGPIFMPDNLKPGGWKKFSKNEVKKLQNLLKVQ